LWDKPGAISISLREMFKNLKYQNKGFLSDDLDYYDYDINEVIFVNKISLYLKGTINHTKKSSLLTLI